MSGIKVGELLHWAFEQLEPLLGEREAQASAEVLLMELTGFSRATLHLEKDRLVDLDIKGAFEITVKQRSQRVPVAYLTGKAYFRDLCLEVDPGCLIPRPETEILVDAFFAESCFSGEKTFTFLDLCCGSGAIGISILKDRPGSRGTFADISPKALAVTQKNLSRYGLAARAVIECSDLFEKFRGKKYFWNAILCNPPYLSSADWVNIQPELLKEPREALFGGLDGMDFYKKVIPEAISFLAPNGVLIFELGAGQAADVEKLFIQHEYQDVKLFRDYLNIDRVILGRRPA